MDLISGDMRTTFLTYGKTGEMFLYRPFSCEQIDETHQELKDLTRLFIGYPIDPSKDQSKIVYGIGPMWLRTKSLPSLVHFSEALDAERNSSYLSSMNQYTINFEDKRINFKLRYYFSTAIFQFVDTVEWVESKSGEDTVEASARITYASLDSSDDAMFKLPIGYGCTRSIESLNHPLIDAGLIILHDGSPNQAFFGITTSIPLDIKGHEWISHRYSLDVLRGMSALEVKGQLKRPYLVTMYQGKDLDTAKILRIKRVWWAPGYSDDYNVYTIDLNSDKCEVEFRNSTEYVDLTFPYNNLDISGVKLSIEMISRLFSDTGSYHLINEGESLGDGLFKDLVLERRFEAVSLTSGSQPVSISVVKKISTYSEYLEPIFTAKKTKLTLIDDYQSTITIFFYSSDFEELQAKAVIDLVNNHDVDFSYLMEEVDLSPCFEPNQRNDILIKYPIESVELFEALEKKEGYIKSQVYLDILSRHLPIIPLQVAEVRVNLDLFSLYIELSLLNLPLTHIYERKRGFALEYTDRTRSEFLKITSSSVDKCATHCASYNCFNFFYNQTIRSCSLGLSQVTDSYLKPAVDESIVYSFVDNLRSNFRKDLPHYLTINNIVDLLREMLESEELIEKGSQLSYTGLAPMTLKVPMQETTLVESVSTMPSWLTIRPRSIKSTVDNFYELRKLALDEDTVQIDGTGRMRTSYVIVLEGRDFEQSLFVFDDVTYEECAENSEDFDGRSFSHCADGKCVVTNLHKADEIKRKSKANLRCNIYSLDYLSKFEKFEDVTLPTKSKQMFEVTDARECANQCMDRPNFGCQGFHYCVGLPEMIANRCYMTRVHTTDPSDFDRLGHTSDHEYNCDYYSRSYLSQFDAYYGKALDIVDGESGSHVFKGMTTEEYARKCVQSSCLAFDVCPEEHSMFFKHKTRFADRHIKRSHMVDSRGCVTFVLSERSQYNFARRPEAIRTNQEPDKLASVASRVDQEEQVHDLSESNELISLLEESSLQDSSVIEENSQLIPRSVSIVIGAIVGCVTILSWNEIYAKGLIKVVQTKIMSTVSR